MDRVAAVLQHRPQDLGRLRGWSVAGMKTKERMLTEPELRGARWAAADLGALSRREVQLRRQAPRLKEQWERLGPRRAVLDRLKPQEVLQRQLARVALRVGMKAVNTVLPKPLAITVQAAVRAVEFARSLERSAKARGMGRGMGR